MPVPQIHRIRIEKFRRIQEPLELDLTSPKGAPSRNIVLAGPNGCGKTSVLEAVLLGLGQEHLIVRDLEKARREQHWRTVLPEGARIEIDVSFDDGPVKTWVRAANALSQRDAAGQVMQLLFARGAHLAVEYFSSWRTPDLVGPIKPLVGPGARPADTETNRLWRLKQRINDERARGGFAAASPGTSKADAWLKRINEAWARFHGNDGTSIDAQIVDPDAEELFADLYVIRDGQRICSIDEVSSGEIELLSFAGWIILNDFRGGLLIIDEPELHLHPQWQATILPALRDLAPEAQFIVASHSDAVWEQAYSFERFLLVPEGDPRSAAATESDA
ncbi:AAA family ATPase [Polyangium jinanense]|uniref:AAA family ATPase n=1 Tax=Polyangium jinanense TaxID=2829994 RepID=A0A9X3X3S4_9BACT|nr:AAA family ATPase [Polyangium jinanense]MDC3958074.1 AAA family ATPase [Polyangium jinanense]MDC3983727.1 AAA family ATPase [Polyangium jinanense]